MRVGKTPIKVKKTSKNSTLPPTELLRVEDLTQTFKKGRRVCKAVDGISFSVRKGEAFGIVGESGSGKTTTGRAIIGLHEIDGGRIFFKDKLIATGLKEERTTVRENSAMVRRIQLIFQDPISSLNPRMTVREIVGEGLEVAGETDRQTIDTRVRDSLTAVGLLPEHASRYPHEFSGGQRQRIGIARTLVMNPEVIIADEPVSALDVSIQAQVVNLLLDLKDRLGLTIIFIAHDLSLVRYFCDRIAVMRLGKILELAPSKDLFSCPLHPYTKALLSAIPYPDPIYEKQRQRSFYEPTVYTDEQPTMREIKKDRWVYATEEECVEYKKLLKKERGKNDDEN